MCETEKVPDLMSALPGYPIDKFLIVLVQTIEFVGKACGGDHRNTRFRSCEPEEEGCSGTEDVLPDYQEERMTESCAVHIDLHTVENHFCVNLFPRPYKPIQKDTAPCHFHRNTDDLSDCAQYRKFNAAWCVRIPKNKGKHQLICSAMAGDKYIERHIGRYIADKYRRVVEIGVGCNTTAAEIIRTTGTEICCTDILPSVLPGSLSFFCDDIYKPDLRIYEHADLLYAIRPGEEMMAPLIALASLVNADLLVYHLGFEWYGDGGELIDCGVILHCYHRQNPSRVA